MWSKLITALEIIDHFKLEPDHARRGWFKVLHHEVPPECVGCPVKKYAPSDSTSFLYLFTSEITEGWFRVDATTIISILMGSPLRCSTAQRDKRLCHQTLGNQLEKGQSPVGVIPPRIWQRRHTLGPWTLTICVNTPGFEFAQLEEAPQGWTPKERGPNGGGPLPDQA